MWITIILTLICFAIATILFTPFFRNCPFYKELSYYFLYQGSMSTITFVVLLIWPNSSFMGWANYVGSIVFGLILFYRLVRIYNKEKNILDVEKLLKNKKTSSKEEVKPENKE